MGNRTRKENSSERVRLYHFPYTLLTVYLVRHAAFRLIEAGLEPRPTIDSLLHVLQIASKTGATLAETGRSDKAGVVLSSAAKWEELVRTAKDGEKAGEGIEKKKAGASVVYLSCRMDAVSRFFLCSSSI